jgi:6-pyruvoyltetrahydropterin/6-carboxytetrahydropterin synthase
MGKIVYATRRERFNAAHKLWHDEWDPQKNFEMFGKCSNPNWHGHNYELFVTIKGEPNEETGYCMDLKHLRDIVEKHVTSKLDHKNLNLDVDFMNGSNWKNILTQRDVSFTVFELQKLKIKP